MLDTIQNIDFAILHWIHNNLQCNFLDFIMPKITALGSSGAIWIIVAIAFLISKKYRKYGIILSIGLIMSLLIGNLLLKPLVARPRPCWIESNYPLLVSNPTDYSFPSGHTLASTISAVIITYADKKFGIIAIILATLITFSRLYLFVHFPSDVFAAIILGVIIGLFAIFVFNFVTHIVKRKLNKIKFIDFYDLFV